MSKITIRKASAKQRRRLELDEAISRTAELISARARIAELERAYAELAPVTMELRKERDLLREECERLLASTKMHHTALRTDALAEAWDEGAAASEDPQP